MTHLGHLICLVLKCTGTLKHMIEVRIPEKTNRHKKNTYDTSEAS